MKSLVSFASICAAATLAEDPAVVQEGTARPVNAIRIGDWKFVADSANFKIDRAIQRHSTEET
jgi:hypothetical protein